MFNAVHNNKSLNETLKESKKLLKKEKYEYRLKKNGLEMKLKQMKQVFSKKVTDEKEDDEECGKACHVKNQIERKTLRKSKVKVTTSYGGDLEDNSIR